VASLKEIKGRIISVQTTQKTTSAMRMVASAKLHRTQTMTQTFLAYVAEMQKIVDCLQPSPHTPDGHPLPIQGEGAWGRGSASCIVSISSSSGLCGAFNSNIAKATFAKVEEYRKQGRDVIVVPIGKKIAHELHRSDVECLLDYYQLTEYVGNPKVDAYAHTSFLVEQLTHLMQEGKIGSVEFIYHHFKNMGSQVITCEPLDLLSSGTPNPEYPASPDIPASPNGPDGHPLPIMGEGAGGRGSLYICEPSPSLLLADLRPKMLNSKVYGILLDSVTSEHAARMMAMQTADDNAKELMQELTLLYNKSRQQAITNELIDIMGGKVAE